MNGIAETFFAAATDPNVAPFAGDGRPAFVFDGAGTEVIWANAAGLACLGARSMIELLNRRFSDKSLFARRIANLAALGMGTVKTERLPLPTGLVPSLTICRAHALLVNGARGVFLVVVDRAIPTLSSESASRGYQDMLASLGGAKVSESAPLPRQQKSPSADSPPEAAAFAFPRHGRTVRFLFEFDPFFVFTFVSPEFGETVGPKSANLVGQSWQSVAADLDIDPAGRIMAALHRKDTFTGLTVDWPVGAGDHLVPVDLAGMPVFGRDRSFKGYRGFGLVKTAAVFPAPAHAQKWELSAAAPQKDPDAGVPVLGEDLPFAPDASEDPGAVETEVGPEPNPVPKMPAKDEALGADRTSALIEKEPVVAKDIGEIHALPASEDDPALERAWGGNLDPDPDPTFLHEDDPSLMPATGLAGSEERRSAEVIPSPIIPRPIPSKEPDTADDRRRLSKPEREAFEKIAAALGARLEGHADSASEGAPFFLAQNTAAAGGKGACEPPQDFEADLDRFFVDAAILDRLPVAIALLKDGAALFVNRAFLDLAGYADRGEFEMSGGFAEIFASVALLREASGPALRRKDGVTTAVSAKVHSVPWQNGVASLVIVEESARPSAGKSAGEERAEELEAILDTATDGVLVVDAGGTIVGVNRSAEALFGMERLAMVGAPLPSLLAPESQRSALDYLEGLARNGVASVLNDGREVIGSVRGGGLVPLFMTMGRVSATRFCAVLRDITQWKRAEEELTGAKRSAETASSQKSDFLAKISHEIRTPLNAIIGFSEVMMEERFGPVGNARYKEYLRDIHLSGAHIMSLVNDLLDLSKIEAGKLDLSFEAVGLNDVIGECVALMQPQANRERIIIRTALSSNLPAVVADSRSLRQIVLNLVSNAVKFNAPGGQVIVSTLYEDNGEVAIRVRDTGPGMSAEDIGKALEPFRQLKTTHPGRGTGLGLPLTKALVEANRAAFRIDSSPGHGTTIQITFPSTRVLAE